MLAKLELKLKCEEEVNYQMSTLFHGVLMELLEEEYVEYLHLSQLHPYTQHLEYRQGVWYWVVCGLNTEAVQKIIHGSLLNLDHVHIKKKNMDIMVVDKTYHELTEQELLNYFYEGDGSKYLRVHFVSPTAFKQNGNYLFYPDLHCVFQSLMNKYDAAMGVGSMTDLDTLEQLCQYAKIVRYDLKSVSFALEGIKIPAFVGKITIEMRGTKTMANFAKMLFEFGKYSGVGIKTSLGMGFID